MLNDSRTQKHLSLLSAAVIVDGAETVACCYLDRDNDDTCPTTGCRQQCHDTLSHFDTGMACVTRGGLFSTVCETLYAQTVITGCHITGECVGCDYWWCDDVTVKTNLSSSWVT